MFIQRLLMNWSCGVDCWYCVLLFCWLMVSVLVVLLVFMSLRARVVRS